MSIEKSQARIYASHDEYCKERGLPLPHRIEFDRTKVDQDELKVINQYFMNLCLDLTLYGDLFTTEASMNVIDKFNSLVFGRIKKAYLENLCLSIACLLDPAATGSNKNLSLARIIKQCDCIELDDKYRELEELYSTTGIKNWRRKLLAHNDLSTLMGKTPLELNFEHNDIAELIELIQEIFDDIADPTVYTDIRITLPFDQDANAFIQKLDRASE